MPVYFAPAVFALQRGGMALLFGMTIVAGLVQMAIAPLLHRLRALLPAEIAGLVIAAIGLAVASLGLRYSLGISKEHLIQPTYVIVSGDHARHHGGAEHLDHRLPEGVLRADRIDGRLRRRLRDRIAQSDRRPDPPSPSTSSASRFIPIPAGSSTSRCWHRSLLRRSPARSTSLAPSAPRRRSTTPIGSVPISSRCVAAWRATAHRPVSPASSAASGWMSTRPASGLRRRPA